MAMSEDYVNQAFGPFTILSQLGHGAEAEVFLCVDSRSQRAYVLRLSVHDDDIWDGVPKIPPTNKSIEEPNAKGSWHAKRIYEQLKVSTENPEKHPDLADSTYSDEQEEGAVSASKFTFNIPVVYGVLENRYLIPVSDPFKLKRSLGVRDLLRLAPANDIYLFELWEDIALTSLSQLNDLALGKLDQPTWERRWGNLIHGKIMRDALAQYMRGGGLPSTDQIAMLSLVPDSYEDYPQLAENLVLRLIGAVTRGRCDMNVATRTLKSRYFRENLSYRELDQLLLAHACLSESAFGADQSLAIMRHALYHLCEPVYDYKKHPSEFELCEVQDPFDEFELFLQEFAGENRPLPTLERSEES